MFSQLIFLGALLLVSSEGKSISGSGRIIGGSEAEESEFPFIVSLQIRGSHKCGGSIINSEWIVTAAHCFRKTIPHTWYSIVAGQIRVPLNRVNKNKYPSTNGSGRSVEDFYEYEHLRDSEEEGDEDPDGNDILNGTEIESAQQEQLGQTSSVVTLIIHPKWNTKIGLANDIALIKIFPPLNFTQNIGPIDLAPFGYSPEENGTSTAIGWGVVEEDDFDRPENLRKVDVPLVSDEVCRRSYEGTGLEEPSSRSDIVFKLEIVDQMICAGSEGKDSCRFDSGGPLICDPPVGEGHILCGITSWGNGCGVKGFPGVYAEVSYYHDWILKSTAQGPPKPVEDEEIQINNSNDTLSSR